MVLEFSRDNILFVHKNELTSWIPCGHDHSPVVRIRFDCVDNLSELIDSLVPVICIPTPVLGSKVSPLEPIHWT